MSGKYIVTVNENEVGTVTVSQEKLMTVLSCECEDYSQEVLRLVAVCSGAYIPIGVMVPDGGLLRLQKRFSKNDIARLGICEDAVFTLLAGDISEIPPAEHVAANNGNERGAAAHFHEKDNVAASGRKEQEISERNDYTRRAGIKSPVQYGRELLEEKPGRSLWMPVADPSVLFSDTEIEQMCRGVDGAITLTENEFTLLAVPVSPSKPFPMVSVFSFGSPEMIGGESYIVFKIKNGNLSM